MKECTKQSSLDLCKLIIKSLTENVESIDINPIALKQTELQHLCFWFNHEHGVFDTKRTELTSNAILTDLHCSKLRH